MPIGIVSAEDFEREISQTKSPDRDDTRSISPSVEIIPVESEHGRNKNDVNVPESLRKIIGEDAVINGRQSALGLAGMFGISPSSVSAYAKGATSTSSYNSPKPEIINHINKSRRRAIKKATHTMNSALEAITQEKLDYTDAKDLSGIAKDMSAIIKNLEPPPVPEVDSSKAPQFVIFAPQFRDERSFETIQVKE